MVYNMYIKLRICKFTNVNIVRSADPKLIKILFDEKER